MGVYNLVRLLAIIAAVYAIRIFWCKKLLKKWLNHDGIRPKESKLCLLNKGPFTYNSGGRQLVFWVKGTDRSNTPVSGYVRTRGLLAAIFKNDFEARWEE